MYSVQPHVPHPQTDALACSVRHDGATTGQRIADRKPRRFDSCGSVYVTYSLPFWKVALNQYRSLRLPEIFWFVRPFSCKSAEILARPILVLIEVQYGKAVRWIPSSADSSSECWIKGIRPLGVGDTPPAQCIDKSFRQESHDSSVHVVEPKHVLAHLHHTRGISLQQQLEQRSSVDCRNRSTNYASDPVLLQVMNEHVGGCRQVGSRSCISVAKVHQTVRLIFFKCPDTDDSFE